MSTNTNWVPFWFETNSAFGPVRSEEEWLKMRENWQKNSQSDNPARIYEMQLAVNSAKNGGLPSYGSRKEHIGDGETLMDFFVRNEMVMQ